jgi:hypothetical protein
MLRAVLVLAVIGLSVYAFFDMLGSDRRHGVPRAVWALVVLLLPVIGPVLWILLSHRWPSEDRPIGPDDDPDFLRGLDGTDEP